MKIEWKGGALLAPLPPAMISLGTMEKSNIITIAWTGIINTVPPKTYISVRKERYSHQILKENKEFVINLTTQSLLEAADFCGFRSGRDVDKFAEFGLTKEKNNNVSCPSIGESPLNLQCKITDILELGSHDMFLADIVGVTVEEKYIDKNGKFHLEDTGLVAFAHSEYFSLGEKLGRFGFSIMKKNKLKPDFFAGKPTKQSLLKNNLNKENPSKNYKDSKVYSTTKNKDASENTEPDYAKRDYKSKPDFFAGKPKKDRISKSKPKK